jgi:hypothetical protein
MKNKNNMTFETEAAVTLKRNSFKLMDKLRLKLLTTDTDTEYNLVGTDDEFYSEVIDNALKLMLGKKA